MRRLALIAVFGALVAGCGGEETVAPAPQTVEGEQPAPPPPPPAVAGDASAGREVYLSSGCGGCHIFEPAGTEGETGPNLNELPQLAQNAGQPLQEFTRESLVEPDAYVEEGYPEGVMPAFQGSDQELADLVAFLTEEG